MSNPEETETTEAGVYVLPPVRPVAPYTSTIQYPFHALLKLARHILKDLEDHHRGLHTAAEDAGNEDDEYEEVQNLGDVSQCVCALDLLGWKKRRETALGGHYDWDAEAHRDFNDPTLAEENLLTIGRIPKSEWVIPAAIMYRKEHRGEGVPGDIEWKKEDALLAFLEFLAKWEHAGLFAQVTPFPPLS